MVKERYEWRVTRKQREARLLQFLREVCPQAPSVKALKRAIDSKLCRVNGVVRIFSSYALKEGDCVALSPAAFEPVLFPKWSILYEDESLLIINKPPGVVSTIPALREQAACDIASFQLVHRLDKETSGVLMLSKTVQVHKQCLELFKKRKVEKTYLALVDGKVSKEEGTIDNYLGKKSSYEGQTLYGSVPAGKGQRAVTQWRCLARGKGVSLLCCQPLTGRTHQLRVHLAGMGYPILGDCQYAKRFNCPVTPLRNLLHAYLVAFVHPVTGQPIQIKAPIPLDFKGALVELQVEL